MATRIRYDRIGGATVRVDPRIFINKPYIPCPKCGQTAFGVLSVASDSYERRCRECWHTNRFWLPEIQKKLIYLDQFAVTNLMYVRNKTEKKIDKFWHTLYDKLTKLNHLQLIVCPESEAHRRESVVANSREELQDAFEMLAHNVRFNYFEHIWAAQVLDCLNQWLKGKTTYECRVSRKDVLQGNPDVWTERYRISVNMGVIPGYVEEVRDGVKRSHAGLVDVFENVWKQEAHRTWEYWRDREAEAYGEGQLKLFLAEVQKHCDVLSGRRGYQPLELLPQAVTLLFDQIFATLRCEGIEQRKLLLATAEFMRSTLLQQIPCTRISASMYACLAKKAPHQAKQPTQGFFSDVDVISCLLPYCDAMFVDRECCAYWSEIQQNARRRFPYTTQVFSLAPRSKVHFLMYLDEIEQSATAEHRRIVSDVYGS